MPEKQSEDMPDRMPERMSEECQIGCQSFCQKECQNICRIQCQKECQKLCQVELQAPDFSGHCGTSTASSRSQWASVGIAGPQPDFIRVVEGRFHQSCPFAWQKDVPGKISEYVSEPWQTGMTVIL